MSFGSEQYLAQDCISRNILPYEEFYLPWSLNVLVQYFYRIHTTYLYAQGAQGQLRSENNHRNPRRPPNYYVRTRQVSRSQVLSNWTNLSFDDTYTSGSSKKYLRIHVDAAFPKSIKSLRNSSY